MRRVLGVILLLGVLATAGCYIETGTGSSVRYFGNFSVSDDGFSMAGEVTVTGGMEQTSYDAISVEYYTADGTLIHAERVGRINDTSQRLPVSVTLDRVPTYVIIDSPDIWDGDTSIEYYVRDERARHGYASNDTTERDRLPIAVDG